MESCKSTVSLTDTGYGFLVRLLISQDSAQLFKQEEKRNPDWAQVHDGLGWSYLKLNRLAESRASFNEAIRLQPANHLSHKGLREVKYQIAANKLSLP